MSGVLGSVHPRGCGEQQGADVFVGAAHGSSPRLRGTVRQIMTSAEANRFIPAAAGNSLRKQT